MNTMGLRMAVHTAFCLSTSFSTGRHFWLERFGKSVLPSIDGAHHPRIEHRHQHEHEYADWGDGLAVAASHRFRFGSGSTFPRT